MQYRYPLQTHSFFLAFLRRSCLSLYLSARLLFKSFVFRAPLTTHSHLSATDLQISPCRHAPASSARVRLPRTRASSGRVSAAPSRRRTNRLAGRRGTASRAWGTSTQRVIILSSRFASFRLRSPRALSLGPSVLLTVFFPPSLLVFLFVGRFHVDRNKLPVYHVPELEGFELKPYVSKATEQVKVRPAIPMTRAFRRRWNLR
jgi:Mitochondrial ribosomal protein L27